MSSNASNIEDMPAGDSSMESLALQVSRAELASDGDDDHNLRATPTKRRRLSTASTETSTNASSLGARSARSRSASSSRQEQRSSRSRGRRNTLSTGSSSSLCLELPSNIQGSVSGISDSGDSQMTYSTSLLSDYIMELLADPQNYHPRVIAPVPRGPKLHMFKPVAVHGLYARMIEHYNSIDRIVERFLRDIQADYNRVSDLLQIIPDLLVVPFDVQYYSSQEYEVQIGPLFEDAARRLEHIKQRDTIFNYNSNYARALSNIIDAFLWQLCKQLTRDMQMVNVCHPIFRVFISFLRHISQSKIPAISLTGYTFAFKINKFLSIRKSEIIQKETAANFDRSALLYTGIEELISKHKIDEIYRVYKPEVTFKYFYLEYAKYFRICLAASDKLFATRGNLTILGNLLKLDYKAIVKHAISTCTMMINYEIFSYVLEMEEFKSIAKTIRSHLNSLHDEVLKQAAKFFAIAFKQKFNFLLTSTTLEYLIIRAYSYDLSIGEACGEAITQYLEQFQDVEALRRFITSANNYDDGIGRGRGLSHLKFACFVESLFKYWNCLKPIPLIYILKQANSKAFTADEFEHLAEIFYHSSCIELTGRCTVDRMRGQPQLLLELQQPNLQFQLAKCLLQSFPTILEMKACSGPALIWLFRALTLFDYQKYAELSQLKPYLDFVMNEGLCFFDQNRIMEKLWESYIKLCEATSHINGGREYLISLESKLSHSIQLYKIYVNNLECEHDPAAMDLPLEDELLEFKMKTICELKKIRCIITCRSLSPEIAFLLFYRYWADSALPDEIIVEQFFCAALCLAKMFKSFLRNSEDSEGTEMEIISEELVSIIQRDTLSLWVSLDALFDKKDDLQEHIFKAMGILICNYRQLALPRHVYLSRVFAPAYVKHWKWWNSIDNVHAFFYDTCIREATKNAYSLALRRKYFDIYFSLFYQPKQISLNYVTHILAYYQPCYKEYSTCYEHFFSQVLEESSEHFFKLVTNVLDLSQETGNHDLMCVDFNELAKLLANLMPSEKKLPFIKFALEGIFDKKQFDLLKFMAPFIADFSNIDNDIIQEYVREFNGDGEIPCKVQQFLSTI